MIAVWSSTLYSHNASFSITRSSGATTRTRMRTPGRLTCFGMSNVPTHTSFFSGFDGDGESMGVPSFRAAAPRNDVDDRGAEHRRRHHTFLGIPTTRDVALARVLGVRLAEPTRTDQHDFAVNEIGTAADVPPWPDPVTQLDRLFTRVAHDEDVDAFPVGGHFFEPHHRIISRLAAADAMVSEHDGGDLGTACRAKVKADQRRRPEERRPQELAQLHVARCACRQLPVMMSLESRPRLAGGRLQRKVEELLVE